MDKHTASKSVSGLTTAEVTLLKRIFDADIVGTFVPTKSIVKKPYDNEVLGKLVKAGCVAIQKTDGVRMVAITPLGAKPFGPPNAPTKKEKTPKPAKEKKVRVIKEGALELNWAFRRLRRQCTNFFAKDAEHRKQLRLILETQCDESYSALRRQFEGDNNELSKLITEPRDFDDFLEHFFGHVIHPGSRSDEA